MEFMEQPGRVYALDPQGKLVAEVTFPLQQGVAVINHTFVDPSLRGQGVAHQLVQAAARTIRAQGYKARPTCSYAARWFQTHPEEGDLLE